MDELAAFALHCEIQRICNRKIRRLLVYIFKYYFHIFPKSSLCHDFIYNMTSTNHFAMFWVKDRLVSPDRHKNLVKTKAGKKTSFVLLVGNCHTVPWHIFKLGSIQDSRIHIKKSSFKKIPTTCQSASWKYDISNQTIFLPGNHPLPFVSLTTLSLPWFEKVIKQNYWS